MMQWWAWTLIVLAACVAIVIVWDVVLWAKGQRTISQWAKRLGKRYPVVPFGLGLVVGFLVGHFWPV